jgi:hypothetical protein
LPYPLLPPETRGSRLPFSVCPFQVDYHLCRCSWESHRMDWFTRFCEPNPDPCISSCILVEAAVVVVDAPLVAEGEVVVGEVPVRPSPPSLVRSL